MTEHSGMYPSDCPGCLAGLEGHPRGRGRPPVGPQVHIRLSETLLEQLDEAAAAAGRTRAEEVRARLEASFTPPRRRRR